jgi:hypothetical protein
MLLSTACLCCPADVVKLKQQAPDGKVKDRCRAKGFDKLSYRILLGMDRLPDSLGSGSLIMQAGDQLMAYFKGSKEATPQQDPPEQLLSMPGVGTLSIKPFGCSPGASRSPAAASSDPVALVSSALRLVEAQQAHLLSRSPFLWTTAWAGKGVWSCKRCSTL